MTKSLFKYLFLILGLLFSVCAIAQTDEQLQSLTDEAYSQLNSEKGIETIQTLFDKATEAGNRKYQARAKIIEAKYYSTRLFADEYMEKVKPIMEWFRENDCIDDYYHIWIYCIMEYSRDGKYLEANNLTNEMHDIAVSDDNNYGLQGSYRMKGNLYKSRLAYAQALQCYYQELEYARRVNSKTLYACYYNISFCEAMEGRLDLAKKNSDAGKKLANKPNIVAAFDLLDALIASKQNRYQVVDSIYNTMLDRLHLIDDDVEVLWKYIEIIHFMNQGQYDRSLDSIKRLDEVRQCQVMPTFFARQGKYKEAYQSHQFLSHFEDSLAASFAMLDLGLFTQKVKERQLSQANKSMQMKNLHLTICFVVLILLAALLFLLMRNRAQKNKAKLLDNERLAKNMFIDDLSREVKMPLQQITAFANQLTNDDEKLTPEQRAEVKTSLEYRANHVSSIFNKIIELYTLQSTMQTNPISCNPADLVKEATSRVPNTNKDVQLRIITSASEPNVTLDRSHVVRILEELLDNAYRFTDSGYVEIGYCTDNERGKSYFFVADTGCGIPFDKREEVFRQFVRLDKTTPGLGLGLTIARRLAENMGLELTIDNDYDEGTRFLLVI